MSDEKRTRPEQLQENEAVLQVVLRATPVPLGISRAADGRVLFANEHLRTAFGLPADGTINVKSPDLYCDKHDRDRLLAALEKDRFLANFEVQLRKTDGSPWWAAVSAEYLTFGGEPAVFAAFHDITGRKLEEEQARRLAMTLERRVRARTEELENSNAELARANRELTSARDQLQLANERFRVIAEWIPVPIAITSRATGQVIYNNDHHARMYGLTHGSDLLGRRMIDFYVDPADRATMLQALEQHGFLSNHELHLKKPDGTPFWVAGYFRYLTYDGQEAILATLLDISERKRRSEDLQRGIRERTAGLEAANAELQKANQELTAARDQVQHEKDRFREIVEWIPVPIAISRKATGRVMYANDHIAALYGLSRGSELLGRDMTDFYLNPGDRSKYWQILQKQGYLQNYELHLKKADGTPFWVAAYFRYLTYEGEEAVLGALLDISERKQHSEELEERVRERTAELEAARDAALEADRAKNRFLANVSHELRNPLNHISGYCSLLEQAAAAKGHDYFLSDLTEIRASADNLVKLVKDILFLTKMGADKVRLDPREVQVRDFVTELVRTMAPEAQKNGNRLETRCDEHVGSMWTDPDRLRQILVNLIGNACKFTDKGTVTLSVAREAQGGRDEVAFAVDDTGIGMTPEEIGRLFEPFTQANESIGIKYGGTGLGLALSRGFCQLMGGAISVQSEPGKGSRFTVRLPARVSAGAARPAGAGREAQAPAIPAPARAVAGSLVLVIDDDPKVHELMHRFVGTEGFQICSALSGEQGLKLARELRPAVITLDTLMPGLDGWEVLKRLKAEDRTAAIPVIMLTVVDDRAKGYELGASEFVTKPVQWSHVAPIVAKYCPAKPLHARPKPDRGISGEARATGAPRSRGAVAKRKSVAKSSQTPLKKTTTKERARDGKRKKNQ
jgi:PAS domain S-box-containing protein